MGIEIERKFLVNEDKLISFFEFMPHVAYDIFQYYINKNVRVRIENHSKGAEIVYFTCKTDKKEEGITRNEWECTIPTEDGFNISNILRKSKVGLGSVRKTRHVFSHDPNTKWEVDIFHGENEGLIIAEIEIPTEEYELGEDRFGWLGKEVTDDERYYNSYLAKHPYSEWKNDY